ncbi:uncharacterized protein CEXT_612001 [Caerostris extrusa]|uniref:Uncharacterized protein n=1 Tax=Caerostris extrusa TaxID=172846 RepID=A0AAV4TQC6_CAEEX|nr:uncharacterized protein CEXT_612001 [Caerostris extrusa]
MSEASKSHLESINETKEHEESATVESFDTDDSNLVHTTAQNTSSVIENELKENNDRVKKEYLQPPDSATLQTDSNQLPQESETETSDAEFDSDGQPDPISKLPHLMTNTHQEKFSDEKYVNSFEDEGNSNLKAQSEFPNNAHERIQESEFPNYVLERIQKSEFPNNVREQITESEFDTSNNNSSLSMDEGRELNSEMSYVHAQNQKQRESADCGILECLEDNDLADSKDYDGDLITPVIEDEEDDYKIDNIRSASNQSESSLNSTLLRNFTEHANNQSAFEYVENIGFNVREVIHIIKTDSNVRAYILNNIILYLPVLICDILLWMVTVKLIRHIRRQIIVKQEASAERPKDQQDKEEDSVDKIPQLKSLIKSKRLGKIATMNIKIVALNFHSWILIKKFGILQVKIANFIFRNLNFVCK